MSVLKALWPSANKKNPAWVQHITSCEGIVSLDEYPQARAQLHMIGLTEEDLKLLKAYQPRVIENIDLIVEAFYSKIIEIPSLKSLIENNSTLDRLRITLRQHLIELFEGRLRRELHREESAYR